MGGDLKHILDFLKDAKNLDFAGCRESMVARRVTNRFARVKCNSYTAYLLYLKEHPDELDFLVDSLTINVSHFFRDSLTFEYIAQKVLPEIIQYQTRKSDTSLRIWSAGCAMGEEPYSIAILLNEYLKKEKKEFDIRIFATDIDEKILEKAKKARFSADSMANVKYSIVKKYFNSENEIFQLIPEIRNLVSFSYYDMLDNNHYAPPESIFGGFDMAFCRNILIYFDTAHQDMIFDKLYRSLSAHGYLVLGEAEIPSAKYQGHFARVNECCHIYRKR